MKRKVGLFLIVVSILLFSGCGSFSISISAPENKTLIEGKWRAERFEELTNLENNNEDIQDNILSFSNEEVVIFGKVYEGISYKAKVVNGERYLYDVMGFIPDSLIDELDNIKVLTISSNNTFIKDIIFIHKDIYIIEDNNLYKLIELDKTPMEVIDNNSDNSNNNDYYKMDSGVLIGLRTQGENGAEYRTLWIRRENNEIDVDEIPYILLPRKNGFLKVKSKREYNSEGYFKDIIVFEDMNGKTAEFHSYVVLNSPSNINISKAITFIGNDYMSTKIYNHNEDYAEEFLSTYVLDLNTLDVNKAIPLGALTDNTDMSNLILSSDENTRFNNKDINNLTNFAIRRKQGRWSFYTLNSKVDNDKKEDIDNYQWSYEDSYEKNSYILDIALRVSEKISRHDEIFMPWQGIQKQVPSATDAVSSPNSNLSIIKTKSNLYIYKITDNNFNKTSEVVVSLKENEEIIMAEWAEGDYVEYWTKQVTEIIRADH